MPAETPRNNLLSGTRPPLGPFSQKDDETPAGNVDDVVTEDCFLTRKEVLEITSLSGTSLWREIHAKRFPPSVRISENRVGWLRSEVRAWKRQRLKAARGATAA